MPESESSDSEGLLEDDASVLLVETSDLSESLESDSLEVESLEAGPLNVVSVLVEWREKSSCPFNGKTCTLKTTSLVRRIFPF